jgi:hypothetical protein
MWCGGCRGKKIEVGVLLVVWVISNKIQLKTMSVEDLPKAILGDTIEKDEVVLVAMYCGMSMTLPMKKEKYVWMVKNIKEMAKEMIQKRLGEMTKERLVKGIKVWMDVHREMVMREPGENITNELLEKAWGKEWELVLCDWTFNVSALLRLGAMEQDESNGWALWTHNSYSYMGKTARMACWEKDEKKQKKIVMKFAKEVERRVAKKE